MSENPTKNDIKNIEKNFNQNKNSADKKELGNLKSTKLFPLHQEIIAKGGVGMLHRSLFQTQRVKKSKHN